MKTLSHNQGEKEGKRDRETDRHARMRAHTHTHEEVEGTKTLYVTFLMDKLFKVDVIRTVPHFSLLKSRTFSGCLY